MLFIIAFNEGGKSSSIRLGEGLKYDKLSFILFLNVYIGWGIGLS